MHYPGSKTAINMAIIGEIVKAAVHLADKLISPPDAREAQIKVLRELMLKARDTDFGKKYGFEGLLRYADPRDAFAEAVPYHDYEQLREAWWQRVIDGEENVSWPGRISYFAVSSGTTSSRKRIPVSDEMLQSIRAAGMQQIKGIADYDLPASFFEKEILLFGSSTQLKEVDGRLEGEISGISASQIPFWFEGIYRPGKEIASIDNWDERVEALAEEATNWDIGAISGIPSWIELMLKKVIESHSAESILDIWPNLQVFTSGGVAFAPYANSFRKLCGENLIVIDTYLASEGYLASQLRKDSEGMTLLSNNGIYFEFVPFEPEHMAPDGSIALGAPYLKIEEVEQGVDYVVVISTVAGAWRYMIGDTIRFTDAGRAEIQITGRTKHFLNVVGSHLNVMQMDKAMAKLEEVFGCDIKEYTVAALERDGEYLHSWTIGLSEMKEIDTADFAERLDQILSASNKNYKVARSKALKKIEVKIIPASLFTDYTERTKQKGGQVKVARVMEADAYEQWLSFVEEALKKELD